MAIRKKAGLPVKKQNKKKDKISIVKKTLEVKKAKKPNFLQSFWYNRASLNNSLFFWGLSSVIVVALFLGGISLFAQDIGVDIVVNVNAPEPPSGGGGTTTPVVNPITPPSTTPTTPITPPSTGTQTPSTGIPPTIPDTGTQTPTDTTKPDEGKEIEPEKPKTIQAYFEAYEAKDIDITNQKNLLGKDVFAVKSDLGSVLFDIKEGESGKNFLFYLISLLTSGLAFFGIYAFYSSKKYLGYVFDANTKKRIGRAKVELRNYNDKRIIQTILTDKKGKFWFRLKDVKSGYYYVSVEKLNYVFPSKIWLKKDKKPKNTYFGAKIKITKGKFGKIKIPVDPLIR